jgi:hypothetical protein
MVKSVVCIVTRGLMLRSRIEWRKAGLNQAQAAAAMTAFTTYRRESSCLQIALLISPSCHDAELQITVLTVLACLSFSGHTSPDSNIPAHFTSYNFERQQD